MTFKTPKIIEIDKFYLPDKREDISFENLISEKNNIIEKPAITKEKNGCNSYH